MILATCASLLLVLSGLAGGETVELTGACPAVTIRQAFVPPVTIEAAGARVAGLTVTGGGIVWRGGTIAAPGGIAGTSVAGYGALVRGGRGVVFEGVTFTDAKKGLVTDHAADVTVRFSRFTGLREDGVIASATQRLVITHSEFTDFRPLPTTCTVAGVVTSGLSSRDCVARGGTWRDGNHSDAVQMRNGVADSLIAWNRVATTDHGLTQMDTTGDAPLARVTFARNTVAAGRHGLTLGACDDCLIRDNSLVTAVPGWRAIIIPGRARACGNTVPAGGPGREPC